MPEQRYDNRGRTLLFRVGADRDTLIAEYDWYAREMHIGGPAAEPVLIRFDHSERGRSPSTDDLAIGIYRDGEALREYSTSEMHKLGSGVAVSASGHRVFGRRLGFRRIEADRYVYEVEGVSGKVFRFDLDTGGIVEPAAELSP